MQVIYPELLFSKAQLFLEVYQLTQAKLKYCRTNFPDAADNLQTTANNLWYIGENLDDVVGLINEAYDSFDKNLAVLTSSQILYFRTLNDRLAHIKKDLYQVEEVLSLLKEQGPYAFSVYLSAIATQKQINRQIMDLEVFLLSLMRSQKSHYKEFYEGKELKKKFQSYFSELAAYRHKIKSVQSVTAVSKFLDYLKTIDQEITLISMECDKDFQVFKAGIKIHQILN